MATLKPFKPLIRTEFSKFLKLKAPVIRNLPSPSLFCKATSAVSADVRRMVEAFDPGIPLQEAVTPPSCWYTEPSFLDLEIESVFYKGWQAVGYTEQIANSMDFFTGRLGSVEFVVCRDASGNLQAFHNVCRHRASLLASGSGKKSCFICPYHGWTYGLDGTLLKATRISGLHNFKVNELGLVPINVAAWGPFVLINLDKDILPQKDVSSKAVGSEWLGNSLEILGTIDFDSSLKHVCRREYTIKCNWKVYCDNYLDGGYHVPYAHKGLAVGLKLESYSITNFDKVSIQSCESTLAGGDGFDRLGSKAVYAFIYPNFMINRYGPWMDTNLVIPLSHSKCLVIFDYFLEASLKSLLIPEIEKEDEGSQHGSIIFFSPDILSCLETLRVHILQRVKLTVSDDKDFIEKSLEDSERVQIEDISLCEGVQKGLESPAYCCGRYAPTVEKAMHRFHCLLHDSLNDGRCN